MHGERGLMRFLSAFAAGSLPRSPMRSLSGTSPRHAKRLGRRSMRAVVDTNIFLSALIRAAGASARIIQAFRDGRFELMTSPPLIAEVKDVLSRSRIVLKYRLRADDVEELLELLAAHASVVAVSGATF